MYLVAAKLTRPLFWAALATGILGLLMPDLVPLWLALILAIGCGLLFLYRPPCAPQPALRVAVPALWLGAFRLGCLEVQGVRLRLGHLRHKRRLPSLRPPARGNGLPALPTSLTQPAVGHV